MIKRSFLISLFLLLSATTALYAQTVSLADAVDTTKSGVINWTIGEVYATGIGAPPSNPSNMAQARAMAERAAYVVALRNLLETVKGVRVDSESVVENFMVKSDLIRTKVDGIVKGARVVKTQYMSDGSVEVLVAMSIRGAFLNAIVPDTFGRTGTVGSSFPIKPSLPAPAPAPASEPAPKPAKPTPPPVPPVPDLKPEPVKPAPQPEKKVEPKKPDVPQPAPVASAPPTVAFKGGVATGLVIDGTGLGLRPALLPRIIDQQGQEVYVGQVVTRTNAVEQGVAGYAKDVNAAANNFRVTDNPAVIKGLRATGNTKTDVVIAQADAQTLREMGNKGDFLQYCRVIIVY